MLCCVCNNKINSHNTIYKGFDMNFCSNICRITNYNKIIKKDPKVKKYNEWVNMCYENICDDNNNKVKKTFSVKDLYSLDSIKIENNENNENNVNNIEKFENTSDNISNTYNFICSSNSFYYINCLNNQKNQENQENILDKNILIFTKNLEYYLENNTITKYIIYPVMLFCKYIYK